MKKSGWYMLLTVTHAVMFFILIASSAITGVMDWFDVLVLFVIAVVAGMFYTFYSVERETERKVSEN